MDCKFFPLKNIFPLDTSSIVEITFISVDFPDPDGPIIHVKSPSFTVISIPFKAIHSSFPSPYILYKFLPTNKFSTNSSPSSIVTSSSNIFISILFSINLSSSILNDNFKVIKDIGVKTPVFFTLHGNLLILIITFSLSL